MTVPAPASEGDLEVALSLDDPSGPTVAAWRDMYLDQQHPDVVALVDLCVGYLHERRLCYSCGRPADRLVDDEFPWVCGRCEAHA